MSISIDGYCLNKEVRRRILEAVIECDLTNDIHQRADEVIKKIHESFEEDGVEVDDDYITFEAIEFFELLHQEFNLINPNHRG